MQPLQAQEKEILEGREFYFGIPHCDIQNGESARGTPIQLWLSSKVATRVTISSPRAGEILGIYNLTPRKVQIIPIPEIYMNTTTGITDRNNGIFP